MLPATAFGISLGKRCESCIPCHWYGEVLGPIIVCAVDNCRFEMSWVVGYVVRFPKVLQLLSVLRLL